MTRKLIVMLGTHTDTMGGISSVVRIYREGGLFERYPLRYIATHGDGSGGHKARAALGAWLRFVALLLRGRVGLVHVHMSHRWSCWRKLAFIVPATALGVPYVIHLHGSQFDLFYDRECGPRRKALVRWAFDRASHIIVLSRSWQDWVHGMCGNAHVQVVHNPVMTATSADWSQRHRGAVLCLGRLGARKGTYDLIEAARRLSGQLPSIELWLGGDGELDGVRENARQAGLGEQVHLLGWVQGQAKRDLLQRATLFALPSYNEGLPMSILEAMAAGVPVVSTTIGGIPEAVRDGIDGYLIAPGDIDALADRMGRLLRDTELAERMGSAAQRRVQASFSTQQAFGALAGVYARFGFAP